MKASAKVPRGHDGHIGAAHAEAAVRHDGRHQGGGGGHPQEAGVHEGLVIHGVVDRIRASQKI